MHLLSQTTQPTIVIPGVDPSWLNVWGVKGVIAIVVLTVVVLTLFTLAITPQLVKAIKALGLIKRTWRDEMEAQVNWNANSIRELDKKTDRVAQGTDAVIQAQNANPDSPNVNPAIAERVAEIAANSDTAIHPAITSNTPTPEAIERGIETKPE